MKIKRDSNLDNLSSLENNIAKLYRTNIIQPLKGFCRVVEEGNLSRAAEKYGVTPGLLTKQIKVIENQLGIELFNRDNNCRIFPNEAGLKFYDRASKIISQLENLVVEFSEEMNDEESRTLRIGTNSFAFSKVMKILDMFKRKINDNITVFVDIIKSEEAVTLLHENKLDIFISDFDNCDVSGINFVKLVDYTPYFVLWKGHPFENKKELTKDDVVKYFTVFDKNDLTLSTLKAIVCDNKMESIYKIEHIGKYDYLDLVRSHITIDIMLDIYTKQQYRIVDL